MADVERPIQFWPLAAPPDFEELAKAARRAIPQGLRFAEAAAGVLLQAAGSKPEETTLVDLELQKQRLIAAHAYSETLLQLAHAGHRLKRTTAADLAAEFTRLKLYDLADQSRKTHPRLLAIFEEGSVNTPEDFMNQNLLNLLPQGQQFEAIGIVRAYEHFILLVEKLNRQKITKFRKPQA